MGAALDTVVLFTTDAEVIYPSVDKPWGDRLAARATPTATGSGWARSTVPDGR